MLEVHHVCVTDGSLYPASTKHTQNISFGGRLE